MQQRDIERKAETDKARLSANMDQAKMRQETEKYRIDEQSEIDGVRIGVDIAKSKAELAGKKDELDAKSVEEYQKMVGVIEGLALAERELLDLVEALKRGKE